METADDEEKKEYNTTKNPGTSQDEKREDKPEERKAGRDMDEEQQNIQRQGSKPNWKMRVSLKEATRVASPSPQGRHRTKKEASSKNREEILERKRTTIQDTLDSTEEGKKMEDESSNKMDTTEQPGE